MMRIARLIALLVAILHASAPVRAQGEISAFGGLASLSPGSPHGVFGARAGIWVARHLQLFGEYSRVPLDPAYYLTYNVGEAADRIPAGRCGGAPRCVGCEGRRPQ